jgi:hypothetical protein
MPKRNVNLTLPPCLMVYALPITTIEEPYALRQNLEAFENHAKEPLHPVFHHCYDRETHPNELSTEQPIVKWEERKRGQRSDGLQHRASAIPIQTMQRHKRIEDFVLLDR